MQFILALVCLFSFSTANAHDFKEGTFHAIEQSSKYSVKTIFPYCAPCRAQKSQQHYRDLPKIFASFAQLKDFSQKYCKGKVAETMIRVKATGEVFTAYYTADDACDGGNSYGLIVKGRVPLTKQVVKLIQDGDLYEAK